MKALERFLEWGGARKDIALLAISAVALLIRNLDLLPLPFGERVGHPDRRHGNDGADSGEDERVHAPLPKRCFDVR